MESYRSDSVYDGRPQPGEEPYDPVPVSQGDDSFGVKVQVQGISGRPYVVLNAQGRNAPSPHYPDVFFVDQHQNEFVPNMSRSASSTPTPRPDYRFLRPLNNYQKNPEMLRPHDPRNTSVNVQRNTGTGRGWCSSPPSPVSISPVMVKRARIPVPGANRERFQDQTVENIPCQPSHIICRLSVPATEDLEMMKNRESTRIGRVGQRSRITPEEKRRSRSVESRSGVKFPGIEGFGTEVGSFPAFKHHGRAQQKAEVTEVNAQRSDVKVLLREETQSPSRTVQNSSGQSGPKRDAQATPDLLKGRRQLTTRPDEETAKLVMFNYLKEGSSEGEDVIRQMVEVMFEKIHVMKSRAAETLDEFQLADPLAEVNDLKDRRAALESKVSELQQQLEEAIKNSESLCEEKERRRAELKKLQEALESSEQEQIDLRHKLTDMEKDLQTSLDQLLQAKRARDQCRVEMRDLQQQLSDIHDELDNTKSSDSRQTHRLMQDLHEMRVEFEALQDVHEQQDNVLQRREREMKALREALEDEVSAHARDVENLKEEHQQEIHKLLKATEDAKESVAVLGQKVLEVASEKAASQKNISELIQTKAELQENISALEEHITSLNDVLQQNQNHENRLKERVEQLTMEKQNVEVELMDVRQQEEDMCTANQALMRHLEDTQSELSRLNRAHRELKERFEEESRQVEELRTRKRELEEERTRQDRDIQRLQEEMSVVVLGSEHETQQLQEEVNAVRDHSQRQLNTLHTQLHNTHTELQTYTDAAQEYHRERCVLEDKLCRCEFDLNEAHQKTEELQKRIQQLEHNKHTHDDKHIKFMEERVLELQTCLMEEQTSSDSLMKRLERAREQMEQVRADLLQERAVRQDLECDKISLERQNKDLRSSVSQLQDSQRTGQDALMSKLQLRIQQLEERLLEEEKENNELQQVNRKLERKMKEMIVHLEEEQMSLQDQRDQLALRLKALKRQLDEAEEEIERLENSRKKLQRDVEEQQEVNDQLQTQLSAMRCDIRRNKRPIKLQTTDDDDDDDDEEQRDT
ncbi:cingulin-like protein 1 isoform X1 [Xyrauchen texanus]|uniref:cingulin-like protein 1 isoform X1 n=1 Tax=Xyrauchen texanus TaxID=154827 RepID=UPI002241E9A7|nr:cingulin-like protein 1 isoform X1 [Xyrauchen texanus]XP_051975488.1 cingulin-like protein 1 isoform X1 [Xyrauchen texanus]